MHPCGVGPDAQSFVGGSTVHIRALVNKPYSRSVPSVSMPSPRHACAVAGFAPPESWNVAAQPDAVTVQP